jgi:GT2 family glycosyltransferase
MAAKVDLIVLTYGQEDYTIRCFDSILKNASNYRLVWVDNGSSTHSRQKVMEAFDKHEHRLPIWSDQNLGFIGGVNLGLNILLKIQKTEADFIGILNNDIEVTSGWLDKSLYVMDTVKEVGAVGPVSSAASSIQGWEDFFPRVNIPFNHDLSDLETDARAAVLDKEFGNQYTEAPMGIKCPMVAFFCTIFKKEVFEKVGLLDEAYGVGYGDDDDFCRRMYDKGYRVAVAIGSYVFHNHRTTFSANFESDVVRSIRRKNKALYDRKFARAKVIERSAL